MANFGDILSSLSIGAGQSVRRNAGDTAFEAYTPSAGGGMTIGDAVSGGGANRVLYEDGSQNLAASSGFTFASNVLTIPGNLSIGTDRFAIGGGSHGTLGFGAVAIGDGATAAYTVSTAIGYGAAAQADGEIRLGRSSEYVSIPGKVSLEQGQALGTYTIPQIQFGGFGTTGYAHYLHTSHSGTASENAINFYTWNPSGSNNLATAIHGISIRNGRLGVSELAPAAGLHVKTTTEQMRLAYDASNYATATVASNGGVTFDAVGSGAGFTFSDDVSVPDEAYDATAWNGSLEVPTKNAIRDKIEALSVGAGYATIQEEGSGLTARGTLNFIGSGITAADDAGNTRTNVTVAANLNAIASLTSAADKLPYFTGSGTAALADFSSVARTLVAQTTQANMRSTGLGLGTIATQDADSVSISGGSVSDVTITNASFVTSSIVGITGTLAEFNAALTGADFATGGGTATGTNTGDQDLSSLTTGAASSTDNAIARFDSTTGKVIQNSGVTISDNGEILCAAGGTADAPIKFQSGSNLTTAEAGALEYDGNVLYATVEAGNRGVWPAIHFIMQNADYNLSNVGTEQKAFNATTNGRLALGTGTYFFNVLLYVTGMSGTSGNLTFDILGAGSATISKALYHNVGLDNTTPTTGAAQGGSVSTAAQSTGNVTTAATGTALVYSARGMFRVSVAGTIVPSITLTTASAAVMKDGSFFRCFCVGSSSVTNVGEWD